MLPTSPPRTASRTPLVVAVALAAGSGAAALAHQLLWTRRLVDLLGASAGTFSRVIGAFFAGLALGAWLAGRIRPLGGRPWRGVALAELGVAIFAVPMWLVSASGEAGALSGWQAWLLPLTLVVPPATAMGLALPWMVQGLQHRPGFAPRQVVWIYASNTAGAVVGIAFVMFAGLPQLGLTGAGIGAIAGNLLVAAGCAVLALGEARSGGKSTFSFPVQSSSGWRERLLALGSGALVLSLEVVLQHQLSQVMINSFYSSALVLTLVLVALAVGALIVPVLVRVVGDESSALRCALLAAATLCALQPFVLVGLRGGLTILPYELSPAAYAREIVWLGLGAVCPMLVAGGVCFPLLLRRAVGGSPSGGIGRLLVWNGLGGWLGAEATQLWLAPRLGLWTSVTSIAAVYACLSLLVTSISRRQRHVGLLAVVMAAVGFAAWRSRALPQAGLSPGERLAAIALGPEGVVATLECGPDDWRMLFNNSYTLGGSRAQFNQERQSLLPLLLHPAPRSVATLGVATGSSVAGAALHPDVSRIDAIELSSLVLAQARDYFGPHNRQVLSDPRVRAIHQDARAVVATRPGTFDVVVGDLFLPWRTGEARLFAQQHFALVRQSLKPGGLFCQWLPLFQLTRPQLDCILRTFRREFPAVILVRGDFYTELPILGLIGGMDPGTIDWSRVRQTCDRLRAGGQVGDPLVRHVEGVAMMILGPAPDPGHGPVNTLDNAWLEWDAGRNIVGLRAPWFVGVPAAEFFRGVHRAGVAWIPPDLQTAHDAGQFFLTLEIAAKLGLPAAGELLPQAANRLPVALRTDAGADWRQWPMRLKPELGR